MAGTAIQRWLIPPARQARIGLDDQEREPAGQEPGSVPGQKRSHRIEAHRFELLRHHEHDQPKDDGNNRHQHGEEIPAHLSVCLRLA